MHPEPELTEFIEKGEAFELAKKYYQDGYICISNRYHRIGRSDREDWHVAMAEQMRRGPADFYKTDGSGKLCNQWREHYIRCATTDKFEISEHVYNYLKRIS